MFTQSVTKTKNVGFSKATDGISLGILFFSQDPHILFYEFVFIVLVCKFHFTFVAVNNKS